MDLTEGLPGHLPQEFAYSPSDPRSVEQKGNGEKPPARPQVVGNQDEESGQRDEQVEEKRGGLAHVI